MLFILLIMFLFLFSFPALVIVCCCCLFVVVVVHVVDHVPVLVSFSCPCCCLLLLLSVCCCCCCHRRSCSWFYSYFYSYSSRMLPHWKGSFFTILWVQSIDIILSQRHSSCMVIISRFKFPCFQNLTYQFAFFYPLQVTLKLHESQLPSEEKLTQYFIKYALNYLIEIRMVVTYFIAKLMNFQLSHFFLFTADLSKPSLVYRCQLGKSIHY